MNKVLAALRQSLQSAIHEVLGANRENGTLSKIIETPEQAINVSEVLFALVL